jgi:hypothetical protein
MLTFVPFDGSLDDWGQLLERIPDREIFQTPAWIRFLAESQHAEPALAVLQDARATVGYFAGLTMKKAGMKILGSPFVGWTTEHMGIRLLADVPKRETARALCDYAFRQVGCIHLEFSDAGFTPVDVASLGFATSVQHGTIVDLRPSEEAIYQTFSSKSCRYSIRKAAKLGVVVEEACDAEFADEYYDQLEEVFAGQALVPTYDRQRVRLLLKHLLPTGNLLLLRARDSEGQCIATGIFLGMNRTAYFWGNASWRQYRHLCPNESLHWYAMRYWKHRQTQRYDLCGAGDYKRKYGGREHLSFFFRKSKYFWLGVARNLAFRTFKVGQRLQGWHKRQQLLAADAAPHLAPHDNGAERP